MEKNNPDNRAPAAATAPHKQDFMHKCVRCVTRYVLPLAISGLLIWWMFTKINMHKVMELVHHGVDYWWILAMMLITVLSHIVRAVRWGLQLTAVSVKATFLELCVSIFGTYALNLVAPRLGEIWRCIFIARRKKAPFSTVLGTMFGDRGADAMVIVLLVSGMMAVAHPYFKMFLDHYAIGKGIVDVATSPKFYIIVSAVIGAVAGFFYFFRNYGFMHRTMTALRRCLQGFDSLFHLRHSWEFVWLTLAIWVCYYSETYVCFYAFPFTREALITPELHYGLLPGLVVFVFGSLSMGVPSNGGLGAWNIAVMFGLTLFGLSEAQGAAFALVMWSAQAMMLVLLGFFCIVCILIHDHLARLKGARALHQIEK